MAKGRILIKSIRPFAVSKSKIFSHPLWVSRSAISVSLHHPLLANERNGGTRMFDPKSDYALNKMDPNAIVYKDATGTLTRLTLEDFSSVEEFQRWKALSDEDYHLTENADIAFSKWILSLSGLSEKAIAVHSPEDTLVETLEQQEREEMRRLLKEGLDSCLTPIQRRRLWLSCVCGHTVRQIAQTENANFQNVAKSIAAAKKKLRKFLSKQGDKTSF